MFEVITSSSRALSALILVSIFIAGCYTTLTHPSLHGKFKEPEANVSFYDNCLKCHNQEDVNYFYRIVATGRSLKNISSIEDVNYESFRLYNFPWWYNNDVVLEHSQIQHDENNVQTPKRLERFKRIGSSTRIGNSPSSGISSPSSNSIFISPPNLDSPGVNRQIGNTGEQSDSNNADRNERSRSNTSSTQTNSDNPRQTNSQTGGNSSNQQPIRSGSTRGK